MDSLTPLHPQLRILATRADRARDQVARLVQVLGADPLNERTRMSMFPWSVFLEHYTTAIHNLHDLSTSLTTLTPLHGLFIHPSHAPTPADQTALYGGPGATHDPPLRPIPGKAYTDARADSYAAFAEILEALTEGKEDVQDPSLRDAYRSLKTTAEIFRQTDEQVNFGLMEPPGTGSTLESQLAATRDLLGRLRGRQEKARAVVGGLREGFEWGMRLDAGWSAVNEVEAAQEEDAEGDEDEDEDEEFEQVPSTGQASPRPPPTSKPTSEVIDLAAADDDDDDDDDDLFGENDSSAAGTGTRGTPAAAAGGDEEDEEMDQVA